MFILDKDIHYNAHYVADEHLAIIISQYVGLLKQGQTLGNILFRLSLVNDSLEEFHSTLTKDSRWVIASKSNWYFVYNSVYTLYKEYQYRFNSKNIINIYNQILTLNPPFSYFSNDIMNIKNIIHRSREFYRHTKDTLHWTNRDKPHWF